MNDQELTNLVRHVLQDRSQAPDRFDEIQRRVVQAEARAEPYRQLVRQFAGWLAWLLSAARLSHARERIARLRAAGAVRFVHRAARRAALFRRVRRPEPPSLYVVSQSQTETSGPDGMRQDRARRRDRHARRATVAMPWSGRTANRWAFVMAFTAVLALLGTGALAISLLDHGPAPVRQEASLVAAALELDDPRLSARLDAIQALGELAAQDGVVRHRAEETLVDYLHRHASRASQPTPGAGLLRDRAPDVQAALEVLLDPGDDGSPLDLGGLDLRGADARNAHLHGADLRRTDLRGADLRGAELAFANLNSAVLANANLQGADLRTAHLRGADLNRANLREADLGDAADLSGANLATAQLAGAKLDGALSDERTRWPPGFDWRAAGVRRCPGVCGS